MNAERDWLLLGSVAAGTIGVATTVMGLASLASEPPFWLPPPLSPAIARVMRADGQPSPVPMTLPGVPLPTQANETEIETDPVYSNATGWRSGQDDARPDLRARLMEASILNQTPPLGRNASPPHPHGVD